jgi:GDPmannose 4,6-dehydratase
VVATGEAHSVREFVELAFGHAGLEWERHVRIDPRYYRPAEVDHLLGDASKARARLGWAPTVSFEELVRMMVAHDVALAESERGARESDALALAAGRA